MATELSGGNGTQTQESSPEPVLLPTILFHLSKHTCSYYIEFSHNGTSVSSHVSQRNNDKMQIHKETLGSDYFPTSHMKNLLTYGVPSFITNHNSGLKVFLVCAPPKKDTISLFIDRFRFTISKLNKVIVLFLPDSQSFLVSSWKSLKISCLNFFSSP